MSSQPHAPNALLARTDHLLPTDMMLAGPHSESGRFEEEINLLALPEI
jgi:hypothetical protein